MGKTPDQQKVLAKELEAAKTKITIGATYQHYKSDEKIYKALGLGFIEATDELCVIYKALYGKRLTYLRPLSVWLEQVAWNGNTVPRFTLVQS